jgi:hydrogenase maturation protease
VLIVDSARFGGHPGEIRRFDLLVTPLPSACWGQGHAHGLVAAIELAQALSVLPEQLLLFAIEPTAIETPMCLSPLVEQAIPQVVSAVIAELALPIAKAPTGPVGVDTCRNLRS